MECDCRSHHRGMLPRVRPKVAGSWRCPGDESMVGDYRPATTSRPSGHRVGDCNLSDESAIKNILLIRQTREATRRGSGEIPSVRKEALSILLPVHYLV